MDSNKKIYFETNKQTWNQKVKAHAESDMYNLEAFKQGKSSLMRMSWKLWAMLMENCCCICNAILDKIP